jgi:hypothetical protein
MATVTDLGSVALATAAGYTLTQYTNSQGRKIARLEKKVAGATGTSGGILAGYGDDPSVATTARTNALTALNANRRHRYAGSPGAASGATVVNFSDGLSTVPTVDVT